MIELTTFQTDWLINNILWMGAFFFLLTSIVIGFWKLIGILFSKSNTQEVPQEPFLHATVKPEVLSPQVPVVQRDGYLDFTR